MTEIGIVTGREVTKNKDSEDKSLMLQLELSEEDDIQTVELYNLAGEDNNPVDDATVIVIKISESYKVAIAVNDGIESTVEKGERRIYSSLAGAKMATAYFRKDGTLEINGNADFAVAFDDLKVAFDQLKTDFDTLVAKYNTHIHVTTAVVGGGGLPGVLSPTAASGSPTTANIDPAKVPTIKVP